MDDEIKEILARLSRYVITPDVRHDFDDLLDYITNLQQEKEDYKSRVEKAIEYIKYQLENLDFYEDTKVKMLCAIGITLLQNGSDDK